MAVSEPSASQSPNNVEGINKYARGFGNSARSNRRSPTPAIQPSSLIPQAVPNRSQSLSPSTVDPLILKDVARVVAVNTDKSWRLIAQPAVPVAPADDVSGFVDSLSVNTTRIRMQIGQNPQARIDCVVDIGSVVDIVPGYQAHFLRSNRLGSTQRILKQFP